MKKILVAQLAAGLLAAIAFVPAVSAQTSDPLVNALVSKGILTAEEAQKIKAEVDANTNDNGGAKFVIPKGNETKLKLGGFIQANGEFGDASSFEGRFTGGPPVVGGPNQISPRIRLRRARIGVSGEFLENFDFKLEGDFQQGDGLSTGRSGFSGTDLYINFHRYQEANFKVGQFFAPFGYEMLIPDVGPERILLTAERSLVTIATVPERQVGAQLSGYPLATILPDQKELISYYAGIFNGNNRNTTINDNSQFMYAGRVESVPFNGTVLGLPAKWRFGANAFVSRDAANTLLSHIGNLALSPIDGSLSPYNAHSPDERLAWGADETLTLGPFEVSAEYIADRIRPTTTAPSFSRFTANGYYVQPSLYIWEKKLQLVAKWERFEPGQAPHDSIETMTGGLNWYIYKQNVVGMVDFMHTWSDFRRNNPSTGKDQFNEILVRLEMYY
jgi:phosphate-selective porin